MVQMALFYTHYSGWLRNPAPVENGGKHPTIYRLSLSNILNRWCRISKPSTVSQFWGGNHSACQWTKNNHVRHSRVGATCDTQDLISSMAALTKASRSTCDRRSSEDPWDSFTYWVASWPNHGVFLKDYPAWSTYKKLLKPWPYIEIVDLATKNGDVP